MASQQPQATSRTPAYDSACAALRAVVQDPRASTYTVHTALAKLARAAREDRVAPRDVLACLHGLIAKSPLALANASPDGRWYATARRLIATEYYG